MKLILHVGKNSDLGETLEKIPKGAAIIVINKKDIYAEGFEAPIYNAVDEQIPDKALKGLIKFELDVDEETGRPQLTTETINKFLNSPFYIKKLDEFIEMNTDAQITIRSITSYFDVSRDTAHLLCAELQKQGRLKRRNNWYEVIKEEVEK